MISRRMLVLLCLASPTALWADLNEVKQEPDPIRRFERALELADARTQDARKLVREGGIRADLKKALEDVAGATALALDSLRDTGKRPYKLPKQYKKGELKTRELLRELNDLVVALSVDDRPEAEKVRDDVTLTHEEFLLGVMSKK